MDKATLQNNINSLLGELEKENDPKKARDKLAKDLTSYIDKFVKSAIVEINISVGQIQVQGTATAQQNNAPIQLKGIIK